MLGQRRVRRTLRNVALAIVAGFLETPLAAMADDLAQSPSGQSGAAPVTSGESHPAAWVATAARYGSADDATRLQGLPDRPRVPIRDILGLNVEDVSAGIVAALGLVAPSGILVDVVKPGSPAAAAGIVPGDVIVQIGGRRIGNASAFSETVASLRPGTATAVRLIRARRTVSITVTIVDAGQPHAETRDDVDPPGQMLYDADKTTRDLPSGLMAKAGPGLAVQLSQYQVAVAQSIERHNRSDVLPGSPQAMLRSVVVVSFIVDRDGCVLESAVYRTNGDDAAESTALASLRRASPLPQPPAQLLNSRGQLELFEDWLFNDNRKFQLRELASPQAPN